MLGEVVLGALEPRGATGDTSGESALRGALWRQLFEQRRLERREFLRVLAADPAPPFRAFPRRTAEPPGHMKHNKDISGPALFP